MSGPDDIPGRRSDELLRAADAARARSFYRKAAYLLHQAALSLYAGIHEAQTGQAPAPRHLGRLRKAVERLSPGLSEVWPGETEFQIRCFERLCWAFQTSSHSRKSRMNEEELAYLIQRIGLLQTLARGQAGS